MIKRTAIRRIVWILTGIAVYAALSLLGVGEVRAQAATCGSNPVVCDEGQAYSKAVEMADAQGPDTCKVIGGPSSQYLGHNVTLAGFGRWQAGIRCQPGGDTGNVGYTYFTAATCANRAPRDQPINTSLVRVPGSICHAGCEFTLGDEQCHTTTEGPTAGLWCHYIARPNGQTCSEGDWEPTQPEPPEKDCPEGQKRLPDGTCANQAECPLGQHDVDGVCTPDGHCPAGQVKGPDGSCVDKTCPPGQAKGKDGTCKADEDGNGEPDEEEDGDGDGDPDGPGDKREFSGGDSCETPPACSGDAIMCGQARIQWRIDCNTRRNRTVTGGACGVGGMPICTGEKCDQVEHVQTILAWRTACALEGLTAGEGGPGGGGSNSDLIAHMTAERQGERDALAGVAGEGDGTEGVSEGDLWHTFDNSDFNPNLFGGGSPGTCAFTAPLELMGKPIELPPEFWTLAQWIGWLTVAGAYLWVANKLGS